MDQITISTKEKQYDVIIGSKIINELPEFICNNFEDCTKIFLLTDKTVANYHLMTVVNILKKLKVEIVIYEVPSGEQAKTFQVYEQCLTFALERNLDRKSLLIALGGGAVGDLGGFVAATFMRGIPFIQIPTTILAHDSAVGGKVAINHPLGKNMVGAFYHPEAVFYNLDFLSTLPIKEVRSGFAEVIKHALISDPLFLQQLIDTVPSLHDLDRFTLQNFLTAGIKVKAAIVEEDEREQGIRSFLNFGHTLAHAIEAEADFQQITHGEAVLIGMLFALKISKQKYELPIDLDDIEKWVEKLGYETTLNKKYCPEKLLARMTNDKKSVGNEIRFVLLTDIGKPLIVPLKNEYILKQLIKFQNKGVGK